MDLIRLQEETSPEAYCDEETLKDTEKEDLEADTAKHSSTLETAVPSSAESLNECHPDKICDHSSDVMLNTCLTCDAKCKVASETCVKDNTVMVEREIPVVAQKQIPIDQTVQQTVETPQLQYIDDMIDVPVVSVVQVPRVWVVKRTIEDSQFEIDEKTVENPETVPQMQVVEKTTEIPRFRVAELLKFNTSKPGDEQISFKVFVDRMKEGQNNMVKTAGEITVAGKCHHETVVRNVMANIGLDSFMDDLNSTDSKCEVLFHVNKQSLDFASGVHVDTADFDIDEDGQDTMLGYAGDETENVALLTSSMSTHLGKKLSVVAPRAAAQHRSIQSPQQRHHNKPEQTDRTSNTRKRKSRKRERKKG